MQQIYTPEDQIRDYPHLLRTLYNVNDLLKRDGIMAPSDDSVHNTDKIYDLIGRPLDRIPTIHIGGTNGKVTYDANHLDS
jgi:folylpolyglutamate synthase/dihydropteroate synthase